MYLLSPENVVLSPENVVQMAVAIGAAYKAVRPMLFELIKMPSDRFLNYDAGFLLKAYAGEVSIDGNVPYVEICDFCELVEPKLDWNDSCVNVVVDSEYSIEDGNTLWQEAALAGFSALKESGRIKENEPAIRVAEAVAGDSLTLRLQKAKYWDQARSNLIMDFDRDASATDASATCVTLRQQLLTTDNGRLPSLSDLRMANTLGVACLIFYYDGSLFVPYLVNRVRHLAVFPGGVHCTASGVAKWPSSEEKTLYNFATKHMLAELKEEVGLEMSDLTDFRPVSLCREMARGGKPQLFYAGVTKLDRAALKERRLNAGRIIKATNQWKEVEKDSWWKSADVVLAGSDLGSAVEKNGFTLEGLASYVLGYRYAKRRFS